MRGYGLTRCLAAQIDAVLTELGHASVLGPHDRARELQMLCEVIGVPFDLSEGSQETKVEVVDEEM